MEYVRPTADSSSQESGLYTFNSKVYPVSILNQRLAQKLKIQKARSLLVHSYPDIAATTRHSDAVLVLRNHLCIMRVNLQVIDDLQIDLLDVLPWNPPRAYFSLRSHCSARVCWATSTRGESQQDEAEAHCSRKTQTTAESFYICTLLLH